MAAVLLRRHFFWDKTLHHWVFGFSRFERTMWLHYHLLNSEVLEA
jgi:hypothetical protein